SSARAARRATTRGSASSPNSPTSIARFTTAILTVHRELWLTVPRPDGRVIRWTAPPARGPRPPPWCTGGRRAAPGRPGPPPATPPPPPAARRPPAGRRAAPPPGRRGGGGRRPGPKPRGDARILGGGRPESPFGWSSSGGGAPPRKVNKGGGVSSRGAAPPSR